MQNNPVSHRLGLVVWCLCVLLACAHVQEFPTALTIKEDKDDFSKGEEAHECHEDPEDLEVFYPTKEWQTLKPGQAVPAGSHVRLNLQMGQREAKLGDQDGREHWKDEQRNKMKEQAITFTHQELKRALKKFKEGDKNLSEKDSGKVGGSRSSQFRSVDELKRNMEALDLLVETDAQIIHKLLSQLNSTSSTVDQRVTALLDLEYLVHQVDNAQNMVSMGGMKLVTDALNATDIRLQESSAFVLGSAVSSNPSVQVEALEAGALQKLLTLLASPHPMSVKKKALFALACLLRHFPFAQSHFVKTGGLQVLGELFRVDGGDALRVRIITMLYDMITEKELISQTGMDAGPHSSHQDNLLKYADFSVLPLLADQGWCSLVPELLVSPEHDQREKALRTLLAMMPHCRTQYQQNPTLTTSLSTLQKEYQKLAYTEETLGEEDGYFGEILAMLDSVMVKIL